MRKSLLSMLAIASLVLASCSEDNTSPITGEENGVITSGKLDYTIGTKLDVSGWSWATASLTNGVDDATTTLPSSITTDTQISGVVLLSGTTSVESGATLTIDAGTEIIIDANGGSASNVDLHLVVQQGGKIVVNGTATDPVIMSSINAESSDWGGLIICGEAVSTGGTDVPFEVYNYPYGGTIDADDSGSISYLVVRGSGAQIDSESQTNGISFCAVGSETEINYISVIDGGDDGVEFYGGTVSAKKVYLVDNSDDSIDWTEGWSGSMEDIYIEHNNDGFSTVVEADKANGNPTLTNLTAVTNVAAAEQGSGLQFKKASGATFSNLYLEGYEVELEFKDAALFEIDNVIIDGSTAAFLD